MLYRVVLLLLVLTTSACQLALSSGEEVTTLPSATPPALATIPPTTAVLPTATISTNQGGTTPNNTTTNTVNVPTTCTPPNNWTTYTIAKGDTLGQIAERANTTLANLSAANCLSDPNKIAVGQTLYVPQAVSAPANNSGGGGGIVSDLPPVPDASKCYYMGWGIGAPHAIYFSAGSGNDATVSTVAPLEYYLVQSQTVERYQIQYDRAQNHWGWVDKATGTLAGNCSILTSGTPQTWTITYMGIAFDYPSTWFNGFNSDGMPGGYAGTLQPSDMPPTAFGWTNEMVLIGYIVFPDGFITDLRTAITDEANGIRTNCNRCSITQEVTPFTNAKGYSGFVYEYNGPATGAKVYYLNVNGRFVMFAVNGNRALGEGIVNTVRGG